MPITSGKIFYNSILFCLNFIKSRIFVLLWSMMKHSDYEKVKMHINFRRSLQTILHRDSKSQIHCFHVSFSKWSLKFTDSCSEAAKLFFIQKRKWLPSSLFISYQQVATIRLGMAENLIFHFILCYIIYAVHIVYLIEV